jgi:hypothetical protein
LRLNLADFLVDLLFFEFVSHQRHPQSSYILNVSGSCHKSTFATHYNIGRVKISRVT